VSQLEESGRLPPMQEPAALPPPEEDEVESHRMPLLEHLIELRNRLIWSIAAFCVAFVLCYFVADRVYNFLVEPLYALLKDQPGRRLIYTALQEAFFVQLKVAFFSAACLAFPVIAGQIWAFVAPGLYRHERKAFLPFLFATPVLFLLGAALVYYLIFPLAWQFFLSFEQAAGPDTLPIQLEAKVNEYLSLVMTLIFAFGLCFQLPVLLLLLARVGIVTADGLARKRKYAVVVVFVVAAFLTPPDVISQVGLALPILLLYEISILAIRLADRQRRREEAARESESSAGAS